VRETKINRDQNRLALQYGGLQETQASASPLYAYSARACWQSSWRILLSFPPYSSCAQ